jgi:hypothetical protein
VVSTTIKDWNETKNVRGGKEKQQNKKAKGKGKKSKGLHLDTPSTAEFARVQNECMNTVLAVCAPILGQMKKRRACSVIPEERRRGGVSGVRYSRIPWRRDEAGQTPKTWVFTGAYLSVSIAGKPRECQRKV